MWAASHEFLIIRRGKDEAHKVEEWANLVSEERLLQLSMLADAGDECMRVTRYYDNETFYASETSTVLSTFLASIKTVCVWTGVALRVATPDSCLVRLTPPAPAH